MKKRFIDRTEESVGRYLNDINKVKVNRDLVNENRLLQEAKAGNKQSEDQLIQRYLGYVVSIANTFASKHNMLNDLINEGNIALIEAVRSYDGSKALNLHISYAVRSRLLFVIAENNPVSLPSQRVWFNRRIRKASQKLESTLEHTPSLEELADFLGKSEEVIKRHMTDTTHAISLDEQIGHDDDAYLLSDTIADDSFLPTDHRPIQKDLQFTINRSLKKLTKNERMVAMLLYGLGVEYPMAPEEIAERIGMTKDMVNYYSDKAILAIKTNTGKQLQTYLC